MVGQCPLCAVKRHKLGTFGHRLYNDFPPFYLVEIKRVERLPDFMQNVVCHIHHIINRADTDCLQTVLKPAGAFLYGHSLNAHTRITRAGFRIFHRHLNGRRRYIFRPKGFC
ncbi:hypothetical protein Barb4_03328 [Bacteroidales bacterium Barb4]|nr:hypothetical protein Barb4_03328 [Bacteroidales bacterium Barb4]